MRLGHRRWRAPLVTVATATALALAAACSSTTAATDGAAGAREATPATGAAAGRPPCTRPAESAPPATAVAGSDRDHDITSFDGTNIRAHWFPVASAAGASTAPTVLMGPGWSLPGDTNTDAVGVLGAVNIAGLREAGFNVLTWDPRGFGQSGGAAQVNSPDAEGRDVQVLMDWVAAQPGVQLDAAGDPRLGMVGGSYGGGIQLTAASIDCRIDAIVPVMGWSSLESSLYKGGIAKSGWAGILTRVAAGGRVDPHVTRSYESSTATGTISADDIAWFVARGPGDSVAKITAPTLIVQGTVDGLFTLDEGVANYRQLADAGTPVSMLWYCGGHGVCLTDEGDPNRLSDAALAWLRHHVKGETAVDTGPRVDLIDQDGHRYTSPDYPLPAGPPVTASGSGTLSLAAGGGSGPAVPPTTNQLLTSLVLPVTPGPATTAVDVAIDTGATPAVIVGAPQLALTYTGTSGGTTRPQAVFAQLVDDATGRVVGNQVTPIPLVLDGAAHSTTVPLETIVFAARPGARLRLQLTPTTVAYAQPDLGGSVTFDDISLTLPTAAGLTPPAP